MKKYKLLSCIGISILLLIIAVSFLWGRNTTVDIHIHYDFSAVEESNVKKITIKRNDYLSDVVSNAEVSGFSWDEDRKKIELKDGAGEAIIHGKENEIIAFRISYSEKDEGKQITDELVEVYEQINNERTKEEQISLDQFSDKHFVYVRLPLWIKTVLFLMALMMAISVVGMFYDFQKRKLKKKDLPFQKREVTSNCGALKRAHGNNAIKRGRTLFVVGIVLFVSSIMLIRAHTAPFTWDESRSAEQYIAGLDLTRLQSIISIFAGSTANNHMLNSVLCSIAVHTIGIYYDEFILRFPNLFIAVLGLLYFAHRTIRRKMTILCFSLLSLCYYMNIFWGLERGYGMASILVGIALCEWQDYLSDDLNKNEKCILAFALFTFAAAANTVTLLLTITISLMTIVFLLQRKRFNSFFIRTWMYLVPIGLLNFFLLLYHFYVSYNDDALFSGKEGFPVTEMMADFVKGYVGEHAVLIGVGTLLFGGILIGSIVLRVIHRKTINNEQTKDKTGQNGFFVWSLVAFLTLTLIAYVVVGKGYPIERALVPIYPLFVFALECSIFDIESVIFSRIPIRSEKKTYYATVLSGIIAGLLVILFCHRISFREMIHEDEPIRDIAYQAMITSDLDREKLVNMNHPMPFYYRQIKEKYQFDIFIGKKITE